MRQVPPSANVPDRGHRTISSRRSTGLAVTAAGVVALLLTACGSSSNNASSTTTTKSGSSSSGNLSGTISSAGYPDPNGTGVTKYDANVTANMLGASCTGVVSFWIYDGTGQAASTAGITCGSVVGLFTATQDK